MAASASLGLSTLGGGGGGCAGGGGGGAADPGLGSQHSPSS